MAVEVKELDGRKWGDEASGGSVERRFLIVGLAVGFSPAWNYTGLPNVGDAHPSLTGYIVASRDFEEGRGKDKATVTVTVKYAPRNGETSGSGADAVSLQVEDWGWESGTEERELVDAVDGTAVLNSAGDVFDRVPTVAVPAPTFTKVMKFKQRQGGAMNCNCKVNGSSVSISGYSFPVGSLLCTVAEKRIFGDPEWKYRYTVHLKYRSNPVKLNGGNSTTDIGWDVAITDAGMREKGSDGKLKLIKAVDSETGKKCIVNSPELLNGSGGAVARTASSTPKPYNIRFQAYERVSIPSWFYSEPA